MPDIPSASSVSSSSTPAAAASSNNIVVETTVNSVPDKIQQLSRQIEVSGTLAQAPIGNMVTLNTVIGPLVLMLPQMAQLQQDKLLQQLITLFQTQRPLTVVMQPGNPPAQAFLLLPPVSTAAQNASGAYNFVQSAAAPQTTLPFAPSVTLSAVVLPNGPGFFTAAPGQAGQVPYAALNPYANPGLNPNAVPGSPAMPTMPIAAPIGAALEAEALTALEAQTPPTATPALPNAPAAQENVAVPGPNFLQPGTELTLRIDAMAPPSAQNSLPVPQAPNQFVATVAGNGTGGQIILKTENATLFVRQTVNAPPGTQLLITAEPAREDAPALLMPPDPLQFASLPQIAAALAQIDPATLNQMIANRMPQPGEALPGALLFFLNAIGQGDVRGWLGNGAVDLLTRAGKAELIGKLAQDLQQAGQPAHDDVVGEWKSYPVPLHDQGQFAAMHLYVHGDRQKHSSSKGGDGKLPGPQQMRFLIDVRMSRLGAMQLDGFLRPKQLDIIMRSESPLPPGLDNDLRQSYARTMGAIGYSGAISFQAGRNGWISMRQPAAGAAVVT